MSSTIEHSQHIGIDTHREIYAVTFTADSEYIIGGSWGRVGIWRVRDGRLVLTISVERGVECVAVPKDGRCCIAAGSWDGKLVLAWTHAATWMAVHRARTVLQKKVIAVGKRCIYDVDFSPDSTRLVSADGHNGTATIWDTATCQKLRTLYYPNKLFFAAKYSPKGDRIATAARKSVQVWDANIDGYWLLADIQLLNAEPEHGLLWHSSNRLLVKTNDSKICRIGVATGKTFSEWSVPLTENASCVAISPNGTFLAYAAKDAITFWSTSACTQLGLIPQTYNTSSIAFSPNYEFIAIAARNRKIIIKGLSFIKGPEMRILDEALYAWKNSHLTKAEALLTETIPRSQDTVHHVLASRALIRARLKQWDAALVDAEESVEIQPSSIGYIAKYVAVVRMGDIHKGSQVYDIACQRFHSERAIFLLVKAVILFLSGQHDDAISSIENSITPDSAFYVVQACMHRHTGDLHMNSGNYERAIRSFEAARKTFGNRTRPPPLIVSLISGWEFSGFAASIHQSLCKALLEVGRAKEAGECWLRMYEINVKTWDPNLESRCRSELEEHGDAAMSAKQYDEAISHYSLAQSLNPGAPHNLLVKLSKAHAGKGLWEDALSDAILAIEYDPSSPLGYERRYEALLGAGRHADATDAFETMLLKMSQSSDPKIREQSRRYVRPEETKEIIRASIKNAIRDSPSMLINTVSGRRCNKSEQAAVFESVPIFAELISSMTTHVDRVRIEREVEAFYRYAAFSHTCEHNEPLFEEDIEDVIYDLEASPVHDNLQKFCKMARYLGFDWAWCDVCCVNKGNSSTLREALVSVFKVYEGSATTVIFLRGVPRLAKRGALTRSIWNMCGWALQEYHASKVVRIYTEGWTPYLGLDIYNYKESPEIISEMEEATGISARTLMALRPGLSDIREKLHLASTRQVKRIEDQAYSLFGIFSVSLPIEYGEGENALGRLLAHLVTMSGDASILAWTGTSGTFNSCLPANITVFAQPPTSHILPAVTGAMANLTTTRPHVTLFTMLYDRLKGLPAPSFAGYQLKLPCLVFKVGRVSVVQNKSRRVFHAQTSALGIVELNTREDLSQLDSLYLVHPWINFLLDRHTVVSGAETVAEEDDQPPVVDESSVSPGASDMTSTTRKTRTARLIGRLGKTFGGRSTDAASPSSPLTVSPMDKQPTEKQMRVRHLSAQLRQPFGALLFASTRRNIEEYRRVAADSLITVQLQEVTPTTLEGLIHGVRVLDVL